MNILVTGANGQLGQALWNVGCANIKLFAFSQAQCNVTDLSQVQNVFSMTKPEAVIHCAAYTAVDKAETEHELCNRVNVLGTHNVAKVCKDYDSSLMFISTDYVFGCAGNTPYEVNSVRKPLNQYGRSKAMAEDIVLNLEKSFIVRTSWMFGDGRNFVRTICEAARRQNKVQVVDDQVGSPTYSEDLAELLIRVITDTKYGIYHATNEGFCSWADLAEESLRLMKIPTQVQRISSIEYKSLAVRPLNSRLSKKSLDIAGYTRLPDWKNALERYIEKYGANI